MKFVDLGEAASIFQQFGNAAGEAGSNELVADPEAFERYRSRLEQPQQYRIPAANVDSLMIDGVSVRPKAFASNEDMVRRMMAIRKRSIQSGLRLLTLDEIETEVAKRRGGREGAEAHEDLS